MRRLFLAVTVSLTLACVAILSTHISPPSSAQVLDDQHGREFPWAARGRGKRMAEDKNGLRRLSDKTGGKARVSSSKGTGAARFVTLAGRKGDLGDTRRSSTAREKSENFFQGFGGIFGVDNPKVELRFYEENIDGQNEKHLTFKQFYGGVPVFAGVLKTHFDRVGQMHTVNGTAVPLIDVDTHPSVDAQTAASLAVGLVASQKKAQNLTARTATLYVYRTGLVEGVPGEDHLAYEIEVTNGFDVREFVYVDAHSNKIVDQFTGMHDALDRRAYDAEGSGFHRPPNYPNNPFWVEGQLPFPTGNVEADSMILASKETYDLFKSAFNRDSFGNAGETMHAVFNRGCTRNASGGGGLSSFCLGTATDDITGHEWGHSFTQRTHDLIGAFQPGALSESYSDIWGETVDQLNERDVLGNSGTDARTQACSVFRPPVVTELLINSPEGLAGSYDLRYAAFGPSLSMTGPVTSDVVVGLDDANASGPSVADGCTALTNSASVQGKIALLDRGNCTAVVKALNAQNAGAVGTLVANNVATGVHSMSNALGGELVTIPTIGITQAAGNAIKAALSNGPVNATMRDRIQEKGYDSTRWLIAEDVNPGEAFRDMWNPTCYLDPGKASDREYSCSGEVHQNAGIPNHAFALLVDGGTYNGQTIGAIGLTKAAHLYYRAMTVYQVSNSNFADHADSIEQSAADLLAGGTILADLKSGLPSGQVFSQGDVDQVKKAMIAVEMRESPQCVTSPILDKNTPPDPVYTAGKVNIFSETFETGAPGWEMSRTMTSANASTRDWVLVDNSTETRLPARPGTAAYVADPDYPCSETAIDETGVLHLASPMIQIPANVVGTRMSFDHRLASAQGRDGGQLMISVGGGPFTLVPASAFAFNPYNQMLIDAPNNSNPRAGQMAFSGTDDNDDILEASWGTSIVSLDGITAPGQTVRFRWDFSNDNCGGASYYGWFVDNVHVYGGIIDTDADGVTNADDQCSGTILTETVVIGTGGFSQTGVRNHLFATGCTFQQLLDAAKSGAKNRGTYIDRASLLTDQWLAAGLITAAEKDAIMRAVAQK